MFNKSLARAVVSAVLSALTACHHYSGVVPAPDITSIKMSEHGLYRAAVHPGTVPIPVGKLQTWMLHIETAAGAPVDSASIFVDGGMPQHGHGLPTRPRVTAALGNGDHTVEGLKFSMGGWWRMIIVVRTGAGVDTVVFNAAL